jgi:hypothetical protein
MKHCIFCGIRTGDRADRYTTRQLNPDSRILVAHNSCYRDYQMSKDDIVEFEQAADYTSTIDTSTSNIQGTASDAPHEL